MKDDKKYIDSIHNLGRLGSFIAVCFMMGIPAVMGNVHSYPGRRRSSGYVCSICFF